MNKKIESSSSVRKDVDFLVREVILFRWPLPWDCYEKDKKSYFLMNVPKRDVLKMFIPGAILRFVTSSCCEKIDSKALLEIRNYCKPVKYIYAISGKRLKLGDNSWKNFFNFYRRFPKWFDLARSPQFEPRLLLEDSFEENSNKSSNAESIELLKIVFGIGSWKL